MQTHINIFGEDANGVHINKINDDYLARYSEKVVGKHRDKEELDHPDGSVHARHIDTGAVTLDKIADGAVDEVVTKLSKNLITSGAVWDEFWKTPRLYSYGTKMNFNEIYAEGIHTISVPGSTNTPTDDPYWVLFCFSDTQLALNQKTGVLYSRITITDDVEQTTCWGDWSEISTAAHTHEEFKELLDKINTLADAIETDATDATTDVYVSDSLRATTGTDSIIVYGNIDVYTKDEAGDYDKLIGWNGDTATGSAFYIPIDLEAYSEDTYLYVYYKANGAEHDFVLHEENTLEEYAYFEKGEALVYIGSVEVKVSGSTPHVDTSDIEPKVEYVLFDDPNPDNSYKVSEAAKTLLDSVSDEDEFTTKIGRDLKVGALHIEGDPVIGKDIHFSEGIDGYVALSEMAGQINTNKGDIKSLKETAKAIEVSSRMNVSVFAEECRITLITYNPEIAEPINDYIVSNLSDELYYNISQPIEAGKTYLAVTTKAHEINDTSYMPGELQLYPLDSITVDGELSSTSENPVQNKVITEIVNKQTTQKAIYVQCDGDHDELKLQEALANASAGDVIYPVGDCVLTNENTVAISATHQGVLNVSNGITLDGRYCGSMVFSNTAPAEYQIIFNLANKAKLKNVNFTEENCTTETINPTLIYAGTHCEVSDCTFADVYDTNQNATNSYAIYANSYCKFVRNAVDGFFAGKIPVTRKLIYIYSFSNIEGNTFENMSSAEGSYGCLFQFSNSSVTGNMFKNIDIYNATISGGVVLFANNNLNSVYAKINMSGSVTSCDFNTCGSDSEFIWLSSGARMMGCRLMRCNSGADCVLIMGESGAKIIGNNISGITAQDSGEQIAIYCVDTGFVSGNTISFKATENTEVYAVDAYDKTICTGNITSQSSIGRFDDTCVVANNITGA